MDTRILILPLIALLAACATAPEPTPASSYTVQEESDGSLRIVVTAASQRLATTNHVSLPLSDYLHDAAKEVCPSGYNLEQDPMPEASGRSGRLVATLGGTVRCHES